MSADHDDKAEAVVAFVSGAIIAVAVTMLFVRIQRNRAIGVKAEDEDYYYDGGDLFV